MVCILLVGSGQGVLAANSEQKKQVIKWVKGWKNRESEKKRKKVCMFEKKRQCVCDAWVRKTSVNIWIRRERERETNYFQGWKCHYPINWSIGWCDITLLKWQTSYTYTYLHCSYLILIHTWGSRSWERGENIRYGADRHIQRENYNNYIAIYQNYPKYIYYNSRSCWRFFFNTSFICKSFSWFILFLLAD